MPSVRMSDSLKARMLGQIPGVEMGMDGGQTYIKYDRICFDTATGTTTFYWGKEEQFRLAPNCRFCYGDTLHVTGVDGRMALSLMD
jgi:hypothetical protein